MNAIAKGIGLFMLFVAAVQPERPTLVMDGVPYELTFCEEFDGETLDDTRWEYCPADQRQNVGGRWDDGCVRTDGKGHLIIDGKIDENGVLCSGGIRSRGKFEQCKGYFEARMKVQQVHGLWDAFWLMTSGQRQVGSGAIDGAEIDIAESFDIDGGYIAHALHWDGYEEDHKKWGVSEPVPSVYDGDFHTFGLQWTDDAYIFYVDGAEVRRLDKSDPAYPGCCEKPAYLMLSAEFGTWAGKVDPSELPTEALTVDYVKVYRAVG